MRYLLYLKTLMRYYRMAQDPRTPAIARYLIYAGIGGTVLPFVAPGIGLLEEEALLPALITAAMTFIPKAVKEQHDAQDERHIDQKETEGAVQAVSAEREAKADGVAA